MDGEWTFWFPLHFEKNFCSYGDKHHQFIPFEVWKQVPQPPPLFFCFVVLYCNIMLVRVSEIFSWYRDFTQYLYSVFFFVWCWILNWIHWKETLLWWFWAVASICKIRNFLKLNHEIICFAYMKHISTQFNINSDAKGLIGDVQGCKDVMSYSCVGEYECSIETCYVFWHADEGTRFLHVSHTIWYHIAKECCNSLCYIFCREPQWSSDEKLCARNVNNEVLFYDVPNFDVVAHKIHIQKVADFSISPGTSPYHILCYVPGKKS